MQAASDQQLCPFMRRRWSLPSFTERHKLADVERKMATLVDRAVDAPPSFAATFTDVRCHRSRAEHSLGGPLSWRPRSSPPKAAL